MQSSQDIKSERPERDCIPSTEHKTKYRASESGIEPHGGDFIPPVTKYKPRYVSNTSGNETHGGDYIPQQENTSLDINPVACQTSIMEVTLVPQ
ncbi:hypothetical protein N7481_006503 [Penicillium waksmanii]|uniref:uncharacterized protein n=1 Tax=Penicillium waksmanii TaxID=69791 RepID=UPI00254766C1|nr:uncharacterized protein N7481_006503 [Penicillium waksmanii]KAJ5984404.1 hypothetical protein N7481_006503 [Penicillium waksmanii]